MNKKKRRERCIREAIQVAFPKVVPTRAKVIAGTERYRGRMEEVQRAIERRSRDDDH